MLVFQRVDFQPSGNGAVPIATRSTMESQIVGIPVTPTIGCYVKTHDRDLYEFSGTDTQHWKVLCFLKFLRFNFDGCSVPVQSKKMTLNVPEPV